MVQPYQLQQYEGVAKLRRRILRQRLLVQRQRFLEGALRFPEAALAELQISQRSENEGDVLALPLAFLRKGEGTPDVRFRLGVVLQAALDFRQFPQGIDKRDVVAAHRLLAVGNSLLQQGFAHLWATGVAVEAGERNRGCKDILVVGTEQLRSDRYDLEENWLRIELPALRDVVLRQSLECIRVLLAHGAMARLVERHETLRERQLLRVFAGVMQLSDLPVERRQVLSALRAHIARPGDTSDNQACASNAAPGLHSHALAPLVGERSKDGRADP